MNTKTWCWMIAAWLAPTLPAAAQTNALLWSFKTNDRIEAAPAIGVDGTIYIGSRDGYLYALTPTGAKKWAFATDGPIEASPAIGPNETIYIASLGGRLFALSQTGEKQWEFAAQDAIASSPAIGLDGTLYVGSSDRRLYALTSSGAVKWEFETEGPIVASPSVGVDGTIYIGSRDGSLYALSRDGTLKWAATTGDAIESSVAIGWNGTVLVGSRDGKLYAFDRDGRKQWHYAATDPILATPTVGPDGAIYVCALDGTLTALLASGTSKWVFQVAGHIGRSSPAVGMDGTVYVGASNGKLHVVNANGLLKSTFQAVESMEHCSPTLGMDGTIYSGSGDGRLYALAGGSAPASGLWPMSRRDARGTANGFVERNLPYSFGAGAKFQVSLHVSAIPTQAYYTVEDVPPKGWTVGSVSHNGFFDPTNRIVRFGPFFDGAERTLSYEVTPSAGESGWRSFGGTSFANGSDWMIGGEAAVRSSPLHPADQGPADGWLSIGEITAYGAAWKRGSAWPVSPTPVPSSYLARAIALWAGEFYRVDTNVASAPLWWVSSTTNMLSGSSELPVSAASGSATNGSAVASMPRLFEPGVEISVSIDATPGSTVVTYAVEDQPPSGWAVTSMNEGGFFDAACGRVKWGPFFDRQRRTLTYGLRPAEGATLTAVFVGRAAFDGSVGEILGRRATHGPGVDPVPYLRSVGFREDDTYLFELQGIPGERYTIESTTNLIDWVPFGRVTNVTGKVMLEDTNVADFSDRFFRGIW